MIINTVDVDATQQNIVMSAGVKQETEKGHNVLTTGKLSQWSRILRQAKDAAQV